MATTTPIRHAQHRPVRHLDVAAVIAERLRDEEDDDELALDEYTLCRLVETQGMLGHDPEIGLATQ